MTKIAAIVLALAVMCTPPPKMLGRPIGVEDSTFVLDIDWEEYSPRSAIAATEFRSSYLTGKWISYRIATKAEGIVKSAKLREWYALEATADNIRTFFQFSENPKWHAFKIMDNRVLVGKEADRDTMIVNYVTGDSLVVTWKRIPPKYQSDADRNTNPKKTNYSRIYYARSK